MHTTNRGFQIILNLPIGFLARTSYARAHTLHTVEISPEVRTISRILDIYDIPEIE